MNGLSESVSVSEEEVVLEISERMRRRKECGKPLLIYLKKDIERDIHNHCRGNKASIINFLVRKGLDSLMDRKIDH